MKGVTKLHGLLVVLQYTKSSQECIYIFQSPKNPLNVHILSNNNHRHTRTVTTLDVTKTMTLDGALRRPGWR